MINNQRVTRVGQESPTHTSPEVSIPSIAELTSTLNDRGIHLTIDEELKGGTVSQVYAARQDGQRVVVKHTSDFYSADPTVYVLPSSAHYVDNRLLKYLATDATVRVPRVLHDFDDEPVTVMEDLRAAGFTLVNDILIGGSTPLKAAGNVGRDIALMLQALGKHEEFETSLSGHQNYYERGLELRLAYPNDQLWYTALEHRFTTENQQLIVVDNHPKNMFVDAKGNVAWIDFGFATWADRDFSLPNCLAHIVLYSLVGRTSRADAAIFIKQAVAAYREVLPVDEEVFTTYLAAEIIHRWAGKWIQGVETTAQKLRLLDFGMKILDTRAFSMNDLLSILRTK